MSEVVARFEREAVAAGNIASAHVAAATDFGRLDGGSFFLVMEFVDGRTLRSVVKDGPLEVARALHVTRGIVAALHAAHGLGIVHRDMKPENVMLIERDGDPDFVKVLDFGIAKVDGFGSSAPGDGSKVLTRMGAVIGTPEYMAPEQAMGQAVDARADLYSVGVILYEMLAGRPPFEGDAVTVVGQHVMGEIPDLPESTPASGDRRVASLVRRLLAKTPENRFATAGELLQAIDECLVAPAPVEPVVRKPTVSAVQLRQTDALRDRGSLGAVGADGWRSHRPGGLSCSSAGVFLLDSDRVHCHRPIQTRQAAATAEPGAAHGTGRHLHSTPESVVQVSELLCESRVPVRWA
jgi:serine/threonine-protein kinase